MKCWSLPLRRHLFYPILMLYLSAAAAFGTQPALGQSKQPTRQIRAVWASTLGPSMDTRQEIRQLVETARRAKLNTLIVQVRHRGVVFYRSELEPLSPTVRGGPDFDPLAELLKQAHDTSRGKQRLEVYAWFNVFKLGTMPGSKATSTTASRIKLEEWLSRSPSGVPQDFLDPALPEVHDYLMSLITECVTKYPVDGVNLDYIRYPEEEAGYHPRAIERFNRQANRTGTPSPKDPEWNTFRRNQVTAFVRRCSAAVWKLRPDCVVSVNAVGFGGPPRHDFSDSSPYRQVHQDWAGWIRQGYVDAVIRMGYKRESMPQHAKDFRAWADFSKNLQEECPGRYVTIGIGGYLNTLPEVLAQYREAQKRGLGTSIFSYATPIKTGTSKKSTKKSEDFWTALSQEIYTEPAPPIERKQPPPVR